jgi:signal transduction histidine kinase
MPNGGTLRIAARPQADGEDERVVLSVTDSGDGMDDDTLLHARDPFFTTRAHGTGMGLAIVERIVKLHDGTVELESAPRRGTTVRLTIPVGVPTSSSGDDHEGKHGDP